MGIQLIPHEIKEEDIFLQRSNDIYFLGNIAQEGRCENASVFHPFIDECRINNVRFLWNNPWQNPVSTEELIKLTKQSLLGVELRGPEHVRTDMIPERIFKNISYGHLGMSNSEAVLNALDGNIAFNADPRQLFHDCLEKRQDWEMIKAAQLFVKENHTYVNRIRSLVKIANDEC